MRPGNICAVTSELTDQAISRNTNVKNKLKNALSTLRCPASYSARLRYLTFRAFPKTRCTRFDHVPCRCRLVFRNISWRLTTKCWALPAIDLIAVVLRTNRSTMFFSAETAK